MLTLAEQDFLLTIAAETIWHGLQFAERLAPELIGAPPALQSTGASFVTLRINDHLRGCIGCLESVSPLLRSVTDNAYHAAFQDPRFQPLQTTEYPHLHIGIAVLDAPQSITFQDEADLLAQLRAGEDGLILQAPNGQRATFLPTVWESLPQAADFWMQLKQKAGLTRNYWHPELQCWRYSTQYFGKYSCNIKVG